MCDTSIDGEEDPYVKAVDVFTHSSTGFPGAWTEEEICSLLDAWEEAVERRIVGEPFYVGVKVLDILMEKGFRKVTMDEVWKQISTLRTEYRTYLGLLKIGIPTERASCVPQLERIFRKTTSRKTRRRKTSTASNQLDGVSEDDGMIQNETPLESLDENTARTKRVRFQRQSLQRSVRTMIAQQRTVMEYLQNFFQKFEESNAKIVSLLGELVALQKIPESNLISTEHPSLISTDAL